MDGSECESEWGFLWGGGGGGGVHCLVKHILCNFIIIQWHCLLCM